MVEDVDFLNLVIEAFLLEMPIRFNFLRSALKRGDAAAVRAHAQSMKSAGAFIGIGRFTELCRQLETLASTGGAAGADELFSEIETEYVRVERRLLCRTLP